MTHGKSASDALELQSCPFCGSDAHFYENEVDFAPKWSVRCSECSSDMDVCEDEKHDAAMAWNTRAACPSPAATVSEDDLVASMIDRWVHERDARAEARAILARFALTDKRPPSMQEDGK